MNDCIFCKIIKGEIPSYKVWEDKDFIAFLDIFPEVEGMTIVVPREHKPSYIIELEDAFIIKLIQAVRKVANLLDTKLENVLRTKIVFEGVDVDHVHAKLYPMYRQTVQQPANNIKKASEEELTKIANILKS